MFSILNKKNLASFLMGTLLVVTFVSGYAADPASAVAGGQTPEQVVQEFQTVLIDTMKQGQTLGYQGRYDKLSPAVTRSHDLSKIARIVVGKEWETLSEKQQTELVDVFIRLSIASLP